MADELETLYSYLLRAKVAIDPLAEDRDAPLYPYRVFFEEAAGPFIQDLYSPYFNTTGLANQIGEAILPTIGTIVDSIEYAAGHRHVAEIFEYADVLYRTLQPLPGGDTVLLSAWQGLPGKGGVRPEPPAESPDKPTAPPATDPNKPGTDPSKEAPS